MLNILIPKDQKIYKQALAMKYILKKLMLYVIPLVKVFRFRCLFSDQIFLLLKLKNAKCDNSCLVCHYRTIILPDRTIVMLIPYCSTPSSHCCNVIVVRLFFTHIMSYHLQRNVAHLSILPSSPQKKVPTVTEQRTLFFVLSIEIRLKF